MSAYNSAGLLITMALIIAVQNNSLSSQRNLCRQYSISSVVCHLMGSHVSVMSLWWWLLLANYNNVILLNVMKNAFTYFLSCSNFVREISLFHAGLFTVSVITERIKKHLKCSWSDFIFNQWMWNWRFSGGALVLFVCQLSLGEVAQPLRFLFLFFSDFSLIFMFTLDVN